MFFVINIKKSELSMKGFMKKIPTTINKITNSQLTINKLQLWLLNSKLTSKSFNMKMINSENRNANLQLHTKIAFPKIKLKKCTNISHKKFRNIKKNSKNTDTHSSNMKKHLNRTDKNSKSSVKLPFKDKTGLKNSKLKTQLLKADIQTINHKTKINKWKEDMSTFFNKM